MRREKAGGLGSRRVAAGSSVGVVESVVRGVRRMAGHRRARRVLKVMDAAGKGQWRDDGGRNVTGAVAVIPTASKTSQRQLKFGFHST